MRSGHAGDVPSDPVNTPTTSQMHTKKPRMSSAAANSPPADPVDAPVAAAVDPAGAEPAATPPRKRRTLADLGKVSSESNETLA